MTTPPGWYDDGSGSQRWWDGLRWTEHVQSVGPAAPLGHAVPPAPLGHAAPPVQVVAESASAPPRAVASGAPSRSFPLWIVFVVLGVLVAGIVAAAAIFLPRLFTLMETGGPDEASALAAVERYDHAWTTADCDDFLASTTSAFREDLEITDCTEFAAEAAAFGDLSPDYAMTVTDVHSEGDVMIVETTETYTVAVDDAGNAIESPAAESIEYRYGVVVREGRWAIDYLEEQ